MSLSNAGLFPPPAETPKRSRSPRQSLAVSASELRDDAASGRNADREARLLEAARTGDEALVARFLDMGTHVDATDNFGRTALQAAAEAGHEGAVRVLLEARAKVDTVPVIPFGRNALQASAGNGHQGVVRMLLEAGANVNIPAAKTSGRTALQAAAEGDHEQVVHMLLKAGADVEAPPAESHGRTALQAAAGAGNWRIVTILLGAGASIDAAPSECSGRTALQAAAEGGRERVVEMLLEQQANVDAPPSSIYGRTALQAAAENGHKGVIQMLLDAGAYTDAQPAETHGKTALQAAAGGGHETIVKMILEAEVGLEVAQSESYGADALEAAVGAGHENVVKILLDGGVNINAKNTVGRTCLFSQEIRGEMLQILLELGAYMDNQDYDGLTPLHFAAEVGRKEPLVALLEAGADMEIEDNKSRRPLHVALERGHEDIVKLLLQKGDDIRGSRVKSWRSVLGGNEEDIIMIGESADSGTAIHTFDLEDVQIGIESEESLHIKQFYSSFGLKQDGGKSNKLVNPRHYMSKYLQLGPQDRVTKSKAEIEWMYALVNPKKDRKVPSRNYGVGIPNIGHIATKAQTKALLICYVSFDFFVHIPQERPVPMTAAMEYEYAPCFTTEVQKSQISWIMRKTESADRKSNPIFRSMNFRSTLEYGYIPNHGVDFFTLFMKDLDNKWKDIFKRAEIHLKETRKNLLLKEGKTTNLIGTLLRDAQLWSDFKALLKIHIQKAIALVDDFQEKRLLYEEVMEQGVVPEEDDAAETATLIDEPAANSTDSSEGKKKKKKKKKENKERKEKEKKQAEVQTEIQKLRKMINKMKKDCKEEIRKLEKKTKDMIELEFNLVSIFEARVSTSTAVSMKRLTWITFVFLPLLFVASLFGMNVDVLDSGSVRWWWYALLSVTVFIMVLSGWACFKHYGSVESWCGEVFGGAPRVPLGVPFIKRKKNFVADEENGEWADKVKSS